MQFKHYPSPSPNISTTVTSLENVWHYLALAKSSLESESMNLTLGFPYKVTVHVIDDHCFLNQTLKHPRKSSKSLAFKKNAPKDSGLSVPR